VSDPVAVEFLPAKSWRGRSALPPVAGDDTTCVWYVATALIVGLSRDFTLYDPPAILAR
jgi:hypothetical protein